MNNDNEIYESILNSMVDDFKVSNFLPLSETLSDSVWRYANSMGKKYTDALCREEESAWVIASLYMRRIQEFQKADSIIHNALMVAFNSESFVENCAQAVEWLKMNRPELLTWDYESWLEGGFFLEPPLLQPSKDEVTQ